MAPCQARCQQRCAAHGASSTREGLVSHDRLLKVSILGLPLFIFAAGLAQAQQPQAAADPTKSLKPVTGEMLSNPPAADWLMWRRTYDGFGFSPLDQINKDNVKSLKPVWTWSMTPGP